MKKYIILSITALFISTGGFAQIDRSVVPKPQPNPEIKINIPEVLTMENGLKVIVVENHKLPKVSFQLFVDYPVMPEGDKAGMSSIFGEMLGSGTTKTNKDDFDAKVDYMGASVSTSSRGFFASSLKKHTPKLLSLLEEMITSPAFPESEFDRIVNQSVSALASEKSDPNAMASNVAGVVNYGKDHPYGEVTTEQTLGNIKLEDIKNHYNNYFMPNMAYLVIVGDVTQAEAKEYVNKYFSSWKKGEAKKTNVFATPKSEGNNVYFVDKPGAVQSRITITHNLDLTPGHADLIKLRVLNQILGGGSFSARLMSNLREDKAYTYGCYSQISPDLIKGSFTAGGSFRNEVTDSAVVQILAEISKICSEEVTDKELELVKNSMTGAFARSLENPETMARFALNTVRYNLPADYYATYLKNLEKVTKQELLAVAKKYLRPDNLNIIIVGNEEIADKLTVFDTNGDMERKDAEGNEQVKLKAVQPGITAQSIFKTYVYKSMGVSSEEEYAKKMKKIGFIQKTQTAFMEAFGADMFLTTYSGAPNKTASILKIKSPQGNMTAQKEYFNGEAGGTFVMGQGKTKYEGDELEDKKAGAFPMSQVGYINSSVYKTELLGIDEVDGQEYYKIKVTKEGEDDFGYEYYSTETGWLSMEENFTTDEEGNTVTALVYHSDYQEVKKGLVLPHKMKVVNQGQTIEFTLASVVIKKKPKSTAFEGQF